MGKIGDLFVRLGLKSDGFKKGMKDAKKETQDFGSKLSSMKAGAVAVWAAIGAAVTKFAQDFLQATNTIGDAWAATMSKVKAEYNTVLAEISTYKPDFSNFRNFFKNEWAWIKKTIFNAKEAGDAAVEMTKAFDAEFELVNSVKLQRQQIQQELNELYTQMRDTTLSPADRQAAADRYKALLQPIADAEVQTYGNMLNKAVKAWQAGNELDRVYSTQEMVEFFSKIGTEYDKMAAKFPDLMRVYETRKGDATNQPIFDIIAKYQQAANQMSDVDRVLSRTTNSIKANIQRELEGIAATVKEYGQEELDLDLELDIDLKLDEAEIAVYRDMLDDAISGWQIGTGLNRTQNEIIEFFTHIGTNAEAMAAKFPDIYEVFQNKKGDSTNLPIFDIIAKYQQASNQMSNVEKEMAVYRDMLDDAISGWQIGTGLNRTADEIVEFFTHIGMNAEAMAAKFPDIYEVFQNKKGDSTNLPIFDIIAKYQQAVKKISNTEINPELDKTIEEELAQVNAAMDQFASDWNAQCMEIMQLNNMLEDSIISSMSGGLQAITDMLFGIEGAGPEQVLAALLQPFAQTATQLGEMLIAQGLAIGAFKESLKSLNPAVAIAAGTALLAVGAALSSGIQALAGGPRGGTTASTEAGATSAGSDIETYEQEITVHVVGEISGNNIVLAGQKTLNKWNR